MSLRVGEVADAAGVNRETLRYYERRGIIAEPERSLGSHRLYPAETVTVLCTVKAAQRHGFTLVEVTDLLDATRADRPAAADTEPESRLAVRARRKFHEAEDKIRDLETIRDTFRATLDAGCDDLIACSTEACCPITFTDTNTDGAAPCHPNLLIMNSPAASCCQRD